MMMGVQSQPGSQSMFQLPETSMHVVMAAAAAAAAVQTEFLQSVSSISSNATPLQRQQMEQLRQMMIQEQQRREQFNQQSMMHLQDVLGVKVGVGNDHQQQQQQQQQQQHQQQIQQQLQHVHAGGAGSVGGNAGSVMVQSQSQTPMLHVAGATENTGTGATELSNMWQTPEQALAVGGAFEASGEGLVQGGWVRPPPGVVATPGAIWAATTLASQTPQLVMHTNMSSLFPNQSDMLSLHQLPNTNSEHMDTVPMDSFMMLMGGGGASAGASNSAILTTPQMSPHSSLSMQHLPQNAPFIILNQSQQIGTPGAGLLNMSGGTIHSANIMTLQQMQVQMQQQQHAASPWMQPNTGMEMVMGSPMSLAMPDAINLQSGQQMTLNSQLQQSPQLQQTQQHQQGGSLSGTTLVNSPGMSFIAAPSPSNSATPIIPSSSGTPSTSNTGGSPIPKPSPSVSPLQHPSILASSSRHKQRDLLRSTVSGGVQSSAKSSPPLTAAASSSASSTLSRPSSNIPPSPRGRPPKPRGSPLRGKGTATTTSQQTQSSRSSSLSSNPSSSITSSTNPNLMPRSNSSSPAISSQGPLGGGTNSNSGGSTPLVTGTGSPLHRMLQLTHIGSPGTAITPVGSSSSSSNGSGNVGNSGGVGGGGGSLSSGSMMTLSPSASPLSPHIPISMAPSPSAAMLPSPLLPAVNSTGAVAATTGSMTGSGTTASMVSGGSFRGEDVDQKVAVSMMEGMDSGKAPQGQGGDAMQGQESSKGGVAGDMQQQSLLMSRKVSPRDFSLRRGNVGSRTSLSSSSSLQSTLTQDASGSPSISPTKGKGSAGNELPKKRPLAAAAPSQPKPLAARPPSLTSPSLNPRPIAAIFPPSPSIKPTLSPTPNSSQQIIPGSPRQARTAAHKVSDQRRREVLRGCFESLLNMLPPSDRYNSMSDSLSGDEMEDGPGRKSRRDADDSSSNTSPQRTTTSGGPKTGAGPSTPKLGPSGTESPSGSGSSSNPTASSAGSSKAPNRVEIMYRTLDYINTLKTRTTEMESKIDSLRDELEHLRMAKLAKQTSSSSVYGQDEGNIYSTMAFAEQHDNQNQGQHAAINNNLSTGISTASFASDPMQESDERALQEQDNSEFIHSGYQNQFDGEAKAEDMNT
ncbi:hypothetical protein HDU76_001801 [Blyttiomyces sp. JEL0837]|nr:hypothetical protein HDU76_001801 [Blyttiomyces sp. JEL0837]